LAGEETLTVLGELSPPELALPVEGLTAEDEGYPLVWETWTRLRRGLKNGPGPDNAKRESGISALGEQMAGLLQERLEAAPNPLVEPKPDLLWLAVAGDLMLGRGAGDILLREGPQGIFGKTADFFAQADLALLNLEGAVSSRGGRIEKTYNFRFPPAMAGALRDAGIDAVLLANNHVYDFGPEAFLDTLDHLTNARVGIFGAGRDSAAAAAPFVFDRGGGKAAVHVFGIASFPSETGWSALSIAAGENQPGILHAGRGGAEKLKEGFTGEALDLVFFHGGNEWTTAPDARTRAIYTDLIRSGADIIIGSHPHIVQGFEWIQGKPVFWSLGNFVFAGMDNTGGGDHGLFLRLGFLGMNPVYIEPYPVTLSGPRTEIAPLENLKGFYALSK
jgi:poly-gamma-glutamate synthesis protein (capsule biosynthesis protein)